MSELPHQTPRAVDTGQDSRPDDPTRRNVIAGAAAATAVAAVAAPAHAQGTDADRINMVLFVLLSGALTGIAENKLAPGFDPDPATAANGRAGGATPSNYPGGCRSGERKNNPRLRSC